MKKTGYTLVLALILLIAIEVLLQVRAQLRHGYSIFKAAAGESNYVFNPELKIKTLRPNKTISSSLSTTTTNTYGLRGPQIPEKKQPGEIRIAVVGGSTVMGAYTKSNDDTLSARLEHHLQQLIPARKITVINGGIAGYTLEEEWLMINNLLLPFLDIDYIVLYSGFNDIKQYCRGEKKRAMAKNWSLPQLTPPKWLLTVELITKNTVFLRNIAAGSAESIDPNSVDMSDYEASLENLIGGVAKTDVPMTVLTNARSFRTDMPRDMQLKLSETAIYYNECFDLDGLHLIYDRHNQLIVAVAERHGFHAVDTMQFLPGGSRYFADATHFSIVGSDTVAAALSQLLKPAIEKL